MSAATEISHAEVQQIRQKAIFQGEVTRDQVKRLAQSWLQQDRAITRVREVHASIEAVHEPTGRHRQVCAGCGTDAGNWQIWPCPTVRALDSVALAENGDPR